jgi:hypothetical protein
VDRFLCFGKVASPDVARRNEGANLPATRGGLGRQVALIGSETPAFRLNSPGWMAPGPELIAALDTREALCLLCRDRLEAIVPGFAPRVREFCAAYLDAVASRIGPPEEGDDVSLPGDRFFNALLPLPCPRVAVPESATGWVGADIGFWDGTDLVLVRFGAETSVLPRQRNELASLERLGDGGVRLSWLPYGAGPEALPASIMAGVENAALPVFGPYRAAAFQSPLPVEASDL